MSNSDKARKWVRPSLWILVLMVSIGPFGDTEYIPSLTHIARDFGVSYSDVLYTMTSYLFGYSLSQLFYGPLSDRFGRKPVMMSGAIIFIIGSLCCYFSHNITQLIAARFFQAIGSCAGAILSIAAVRDAFPERERGKMYARINAAFALAPTLGPIVGGYIDSLFGWQANFLVLLVLSIILFFSVWWAFPETLKKPNLLAIKASQLIKNYLVLFKDPYYSTYLLVLGLCVGMVYTCLTESPSLIMITLGLSIHWYVVVALSVFFGFCSGSLLCSYFSAFFRPNTLILIGLSLILTTAIIMGIVTYLGVLSLTSILVPISIIFAGIALILPMATSMAMIPFENVTGSASAMLGFFQMGLASLCTAALGIFRHGSQPLTLPISFTILSLIALIIFLTFVLCRPGKNRAVV